MQEPNKTIPEFRKFSLFSKTIAKSCEGLLKPIYKKHGFAEHRIITDWHEIVGAQFSNLSAPLKLVNSRQQGGGTLHVMVASGRALEMQHLQHIIIDKIATYFGFKAVDRIVLIQTSAQIFRKKKVAKPEIPSNYSQELLNIVAICDDADLQKSLKALGSLILAK